MANSLDIKISAYYKFVKKPICSSLAEHHINSIFIEHKKKIGSPKIQAELLDRGLVVNIKKVKRIMQKQDLYCDYIKKRKYKRIDLTEDLLKMDFSTTKINEVWVTDITELKVNQKKYYLCPIMDLNTRKIISWSLQNNQKKEIITVQLEEIIKKRKLCDSLIFHSDKGAQFTSNKIKKILDKNNIRQSISKGGCYGNAVAESFFSIFKKELGSKFETEEDMRLSISLWIDGYYNNKRKHGSLGYKTPNEAEEAA